MSGYDQIEHSRLTHVGVRRSHNQDSSAVLLAADLEQWRQHGHVFLVADGMGGHAVGELASELASSIIPHTYHKYSGEGPGAALRKAFHEANASIHSRGQQNQGRAAENTSRRRPGRGCDSSGNDNRRFAARLSPRSDRPSVHLLERRQWWSRPTKPRSRQVRSDLWP